MMSYLSSPLSKAARYIILLSSLAASTAIASASSGAVDISSVIQRECSSDNRGFEIELMSNHTNPDSCSVAKTISISCDRLAFNQLVSMSLAAMMADKKIVAWLSGCNGDGKALATAIRVIK